MDRGTPAAGGHCQLIPGPHGMQHERGSRGAGAISHLRSLAGTLPLRSVLSPGVSVLASRLRFFLNGAPRGRNICHPEVGNSR